MTTAYNEYKLIKNQVTLLKTFKCAVDDDIYAGNLSWMEEMLTDRLT